MTEEIEAFCTNHNIKFYSKSIFGQYHYVAEFPDGYILKRSSQCGDQKYETKEFLNSIKNYSEKGKQL